MSILPIDAEEDLFFVPYAFGVNNGKKNINASSYTQTETSLFLQRCLGRT